MKYKTLTYSIEGKFFYSIRFWADATGKVYGPRERPPFVGGIPCQMRQLEAALTELDREGWELVSASVWTELLFTRAGCAVLRQSDSSTPRT